VSRIGVGMPSVPMKSPTPPVPLIMNHAFSGTRPSSVVSISMKT
jgi:hypothetical protein